jgi:hypothetical protein
MDMGRIIDRIMDTDRISGTVIGAMEAGEVIGTAEAMEDGTDKKSGKIPHRGSDIHPG